jgi:transcriptional regulator with GAF, ATPase, and Fis domain
MLDLEKWTQDRHRAGTTADIARKLYSAGYTLEAAKQRMEQYFLLEAMMDNDGLQTKVAERFQCHRNQVRGLMRRFGFDAHQLRTAAKLVKALRKASQ